MNKKIKIILVFFCLLALSAVILSIFVSSHPLGVSPDSTVYIEAARNLASGKGYIARGEPLTHYPPGYPLFLTLATWIAGDVFPAANWLQALLFVSNGFLVGYCVYESSGKRVFPTGLAVLAFFISPAMFLIHAMAWSEGLFLFFGLFSTLTLALYIKSARLWWLGAVSLAVAGAILTRYIGMVLLPTIIVCLLWFNGRTWKRKWFDVGLASLLADLPVVLFMGYNRLNADNLTGRSLAVHLPGIMQVKTLLSTLFDFWLPLDITRWLKLLILACLAGLILWALWSSRKTLSGDQDEFPTAFSLVYGVAFILFYLGFLAFSISFLDAFTPLDRRILSPVLVAVLILVLGPVWKRLSDRRTGWLQWALAIFVTLSLVVNVRLTASWIERWRNQGVEYSGDAWTQLEVVQKVKDLDNDLGIYSNAQDVFIFLTQKPVFRLPYKSDPTSLIENPDYAREMQAMCRDVLGKKAVIVMIVQENWRWYYPTVDEILSACEMLHHMPFGEGILIGMRSP